MTQCGEEAHVHFIRPLLQGNMTGVCLPVRLHTGYYHSLSISRT